MSAALPSQAAFQLRKPPVQLDGFAELVARLQDGPGRAEAHRRGLGAQQRAQRVGGLRHGVGHLPQRTLHHLRAHLGNTAAEVQISQPAGRRALSYAGDLGGIADGKPTGQGQQ